MRFCYNVKGVLSFVNRALLKFDSKMVESVLFQEPKVVFSNMMIKIKASNQAFSENQSASNYGALNITPYQIATYLQLRIDKLFVRTPFEPRG